MSRIATWTFFPDRARGNRLAQQYARHSAATSGGTPAESGPFTVRLKLPAGYKLGPHWHPRDEIAIVLSGTVYFGTGETFSPAQGKAYPAGSFVVLSANTPPHFTWTRARASSTPTA